MMPLRTLFPATWSLLHQDEHWSECLGYHLIPWNKSTILVCTLKEGVAGTIAHPLSKQQIRSFTLWSGYCEGSSTPLVIHQSTSPSLLPRRPCQPTANCPKILDWFLQPFKFVFPPFTSTGDLSRRFGAKIRGALAMPCYGWSLPHSVCPTTHIVCSGSGPDVRGCATGWERTNIELSNQNGDPRRD